MKNKNIELSLDDINAWSKFTQTIEKTNIEINKPYLAQDRKVNNFSKLIARPKSKESVNTLSIDKKTFERMKGGKLSPEKTLDLHGMTYDKALVEVNRFVISSFNAKKRLILIITGKGRVRPENTNFFEENSRGILRRSVPQWLNTKELSRFILGVSSAHISHGGSGAYYVYLRRNKFYNT